LQQRKRRNVIVDFHAIKATPLSEIRYIDPRKGYVCVCPDCKKEFVSRETMMEAENKFNRHKAKAHGKKSLRKKKG
jgi:hypothetical protein